MTDIERATDYDFWRKHAPDALLYREDNKHLSPEILRIPWPVNDPAPPLVIVQITPAGLAAPELGFFAQNAGLLSLATSLIPGVGNITSAAISLAIAGLSVMDSLDYAKQFKVSLSQFDPSYTPKRFPVVLPLNQAQVALQRKEFIPAYVVRFQKALDTGDLNFISSVVADPLPPYIEPGKLVNDMRTIQSVGNLYGLSTLANNAAQAVTRAAPSFNWGSALGNLGFNLLGTAATTAVSGLIGNALRPDQSQGIQATILQVPTAQQSAHTQNIGPQNGVNQQQLLTLDQIRAALGGTVQPQPSIAQEPEKDNSQLLLIGFGLLAIVLLARR